ncbi:MAG: GDP-mannose 4,6-dehydratase [Crocinitomicaceae bacterium]
MLNKLGHSSNTKGKKILITGGAGFIGSNLCEYLSVENEVVCIDNLLTGHRENIQHLIDSGRILFHEGDITDTSFLDYIFSTYQFDAVCHQAALGSVPRSIKNPIPTQEINSTGFLNVLHHAKESGIKRFVFASSSSVYGDSKELPKVESNIGEPLSPYAVTKLTNEKYAKVYRDIHGMEIIGTRYFNVFGPNQDPNGVYAAVVPKFIQILRNGKSPEIYGDGLQTRDFTFIANVLHANDLALSTTNQSAFGEIYNVACGDSFSLNHVFEVIKSALNKNGIDVASIQAVYKEEREGDIKNSLADLSKIASKLNYEPLYTFEQGMDLYISTLLEG